MQWRLFSILYIRVSLFSLAFYWEAFLQFTTICERGMNPIDF